LRKIEAYWGGHLCRSYICGKFYVHLCFDKMWNVAEVVIVIVCYQNCSWMLDGSAGYRSYKN